MEQCKKTSRHWPPSTMGIACATMLTPRMWRRRCGLFSMRRRRSGKNSKKDWLLRNPRIPKRMRWRRQEPSRATTSKRGRGRTGAQEPPRVCIHQTRWTSRPTSCRPTYSEVDAVEVDVDDNDEDDGVAQTQEACFTHPNPQTENHLWLTGFYAYLGTPQAGFK